MASKNSSLSIAYLAIFILSTFVFLTLPPIPIVTVKAQVLEVLSEDRSVKSFKKIYYSGVFKLLPSNHVVTRQISEQDYTAYKPGSQVELTLEQHVADNLSFWQRLDLLKYHVLSLGVSFFSGIMLLLWILNHSGTRKD